MAIWLLSFVLHQHQAFIAPQAFELLAHSRVGRGTAIDISFKALILSDQANLCELAHFQTFIRSRCQGWLAFLGIHDSPSKYSC